VIALGSYYQDMAGRLGKTQRGAPLPSDTVIAPEKLTSYLLLRQARGDKSVFLATAGYTLENSATDQHG
jgi:hypothetical protein